MRREVGAHRGPTRCVEGRHVGLEDAGALIHGEHADARADAPRRDVRDISLQLLEGLWALFRTQIDDHAQVAGDARDVPDVAADELGRAVVVVQRAVCEEGEGVGGLADGDVDGEEGVEGMEDDEVEDVCEEGSEVWTLR